MPKSPASSDRLPPGGYEQLMKENSGLVYCYLVKNYWAERKYGREATIAALQIALFVALKAWVKCQDERNLNAFMIWYVKNELRRLRISEMFIKPPRRQSDDREFIAALPHVNSIDALLLLDAADETDPGMKLPDSMISTPDPTYEAVERMDTFTHFSPLQKRIIGCGLEGGHYSSIAGRVGLPDYKAVKQEYAKMAALVE